jgi:hypothetical protein
MATMSAMPPGGRCGLVARDVAHSPLLLPHVPAHLLTIAGLFVAKTPVLVEGPTGGVRRLAQGASIRELAQRLWPSRRTIGRWWRALQARFDEHSFYLRSRFPQLGRAVDWKAFWSNCFERMSLALAMGQLDQAGVSVP